ncbi:PhzF family phenazine biosynthesis protein [Planococcus sp. 107-1]|nr:PhzF family phenazine biosynthesis protein [Planococcus sp. 107-1]UJF27756.1 PhzF family phenazine biosynthesis protein [Planococcus sp. 107-1]
MGIPEDPATGAASGPLGAYLVENGVIAPSKNQFYYIRSEQGFEMERPSFIDIIVDKSKGAISSIKISGNVANVGTGQLQLPT